MSDDARPPAVPDAQSEGPTLLPHPRTGLPHPSPVAPGQGWPGDVADEDTPVATTAAQVRCLAHACGADLDELNARSTVCRACPRLVEWREEVATTKRAAFRDQPYWGRPAASFGDPEAHVLVLGLAPAAHGANRTGRMFTGDRSGDWIVASLHRAGMATGPDSLDAGDGLELRGARMVAPVRCAPPANKPTPAEIAACSGWLDAELAQLTHVRAILTLGSIAWTSALRAAERQGWQVPRPRPRFTHGARGVLVAPDGREVTLVGCYHVSQQNTFTGRLTEAMLDEAVTAARDC